MAKTRHLYKGRAGQMAVMAEFLWRGWNVAIPEVDIGDDLFVVEDESGDLWRIQVKTATAKVQRESFAAQFSVTLNQLSAPRVPPLVYVFAVRRDSGWAPFVLISQEDLWNERAVWGVGSLSQGQVNFRLVYEGALVRCGGRDFSRFLDDWSRWPVLTHLSEPRDT